MTSEAPQKWFVMLQDEVSAGRVIAPLRPFLKFNRRMDKQIARLERRIRAEIPQLGSERPLMRAGEAVVGRGAAFCLP